MLLDRAELGPVCSPRLVSTLGRPFATEEDLEGCVPSTGTTARNGAAGSPEAASPASRSAGAIAAATICRCRSTSPLTAPLGDGVLPRSFRRTVPAIGGWYASCAPTALKWPAVRAFLRWIGTEFGAAVDEIDGRGAPADPRDLFGLLGRAGHRGAEASA
ncbi:MAG: hypothetical protein GX458_11085 [Phyllobacteriaceae bacterium]|nr:hypothetical protein [Phyllobacteriaceae bacterium]